MTLQRARHPATADPEDVPHNPKSRDCSCRLRQPAPRTPKVFFWLHLCARVLEVRRPCPSRLDGACGSGVAMTCATMARAHGPDTALEPRCELEITDKRVMPR